eukprot:TRINITY_DN20685_c0_g1_i1.p1 TRINITY_DN20685_c0_g1~~TRINITY_DN20685_c0_g1_i1.p1  ORF type:complete len:263 (-),score=20.84 TRINITY_DN20685_c0_g1_i1:512-1228(-)
MGSSGCASRRACCPTCISWVQVLRKMPRRSTSRASRNTSCSGTPRRKASRSRRRRRRRSSSSSSWRRERAMQREQELRDMEEHRKYEDQYEDWRVKDLAERNARERLWYSEREHEKALARQRASEKDKLREIEREKEKERKRKDRERKKLDKEEENIERTAHEMARRTRIALAVAARREKHKMGSAEVDLARLIREAKTAKALHGTSLPDDMSPDKTHAIESRDVGVVSQDSVVILDE